MNDDMAKIREALHRMHDHAVNNGPPYMRIPADPTDDADLILAAAIDELEALRAALAEIARPKRGGIEANDSDEEWFEYLRNALERERAIARSALSATDSAEWLEKHDAEVRAPLRAQVDSLTQQLTAATNDAARAELRVRDLREAGDELNDIVTGHIDDGDKLDSISLQPMRTALAVAPDSDARLREVMLKVAERVHDVIWNADEPVIKTELPEIVDEVLRGGA